MTKSDVAACIKVRASTTQNPFSIEALSEAGITDASVARMLETTHRGWVAESDNEIIGFAMGDCSNCEFWVVAVLPDFEGRGVGKELTELVQKSLFTSGCSELWLWTSPEKSTRAFHLYTNLGWEDHGITKGERILKLRAKKG